MGRLFFNSPKIQLGCNGYGACKFNGHVFCAVSEIPFGSGTSDPIRRVETLLMLLLFSRLKF
jgi:hypothetical protein